MKSVATPKAHVPVRTCLGCRLKAPKAKLIRLVATPDGYQIDKRTKVQSRGHYVCSEQCLDKFMNRRKSKPIKRKELK